MTRIVLVDEHDQEIGLKERSEITPSDIYRVSALWVTNSAGDVLLAQRSLAKAKGGGKWGPAAAGTVDEGEAYLDNIIKETEEEIGYALTKADLYQGPKIKLIGDNVHFVTWYYATLDVPLEAFSMQEEEVMDMRWIPFSEFLELYETTPEIFLQTMKQWLPQVLGGREKALKL